MKYVIIDYSKTVKPIKKQKYLRLFNYLQIFKQHRQLNIERKEINCYNLEFIYITLQISSNNLKQLKPEQTKKKIQGIFDKKEKYCLLTCQPELFSYLPHDMEWCEDMDEIYINILATLILQHGDKQKSANKEKTNKQLYYQKDAQLLFIDDGSRDAAAYIRRLSENWNYVTVCSNRHGELEPVYEQLYAEEGLMVQCCNYTGKINSEPGRLTIVIDLSADWKGIHRIYPENSYVYDTIFSKEKQAYLRIKQVQVAEYMQLAELGNCPKPLTKSL